MHLNFSINSLLSSRNDMKFNLKSILITINNESLILFRMTVCFSTCAQHIYKKNTNNTMKIGLNIIYVTMDDSFSCGMIFAISYA